MMVRESVSREDLLRDRVVGAGLAGCAAVRVVGVISQEIGNGLNLWFGPFRFGLGSFWCSGGLVVEGEASRVIAAFDEVV